MKTRIPVTVLTGFLGSGKTTLLNRILSEHHGQRIAVIENEFGEIGIDQALVINADEEVFEMNNGCICCTVRGDLIRVLGNLLKRRDKFDRILVETTGMANPGPVAQTFFVDEDVQQDFVLDGIITLVDAKHLTLHIDESEEAREQVAFADVVVFNKVDLVEPDELQALRARVSKMNPLATQLTGSYGNVPLAQVLSVGGFDLSRALERKPAFLEPEYPFEWAGMYQLPAGRYALEFAAGPDPTCKVCIVATVERTAAQIAEDTFRAFAAPATAVNAGVQPLQASDVVYELTMPTGTTVHRFVVDIPIAGAYTVLTQHLPEEFAMQLVDAAGQPVAPAAEHAFAAAHSHDDSVTSVSLEFAQPFDETRLNKWISKLLREQGANIFRMKGILDIAGTPKRYVFQAVHMLFDGQADRPWGDAPRQSQLVFIGRELNHAALQQGLESCLA